jgi:hypothetical protein
MPIVFGNYSSEGAASDIEEGEHPALISRAELVVDEHGEPAILKPMPGYKGGPKHQCDVTFAINGSEAETVRRRYSISYGQNNQTGAWAGWAELIAAAVGIPCGAKNQRQVTDEDLLGQWCRVVLKNEDKSGKTYLNVKTVLGPKKARPQAAPAPEIEEEPAF